jgi:hypothetical protein
MHYVRETLKKAGMHEMQTELLIGLECCGQRLLNSFYLVGSIHA